MTIPDIEDLKDRVAADRKALRDGLDRATAAVGAADRELLRWILSCDRSELWRQDGCRNMAQWLSGKLGISNWKARRWIDASYVLEHLPHTSAALQSGALSLDKTVELTRFATPATEKKLISWARRVTVACIRQKGDEETTRSLEKAKTIYESRHLRWWWSLDGDFLGFDGLLPADQGAVVKEAIDRLAHELPLPPDQEDASAAMPGLKNEDPTMDQRRADAFLLLASTQAGDRADADRTTLVLHAPIESLSHDEGNCSFAGGPVLHPETARRLACDARLQVVLHGKDGNPLGIGGTSQITPWWLRRQVFHRDGDTCTFPGCEAKHFLTPHHILFWTRGGPTDLDNLVTVCSFHHTLVHEFGWIVELVGGTDPLWFRPDGRRYDPGPDPPDDLPESTPTDRRLLSEAMAYSRLFDLLSVL